MIERPAPSPSEPLAVGNNLDVRVRAETEQEVIIRPVQQSNDRWHKVLNALYHEGVMAGLRDREYRLLHVMLLLRDEQGFAYAPIADLMRLTGYTSAQNIDRARTGLLAHPRRLLAAAGRDRFEVLPGWSFATRPAERADARTHVRDGPYMRTEKPYACTQTAPAAQGNARAQPSQPDEELARSKPAERTQLGSRLAGWPEPGLFGENQTEVATPQQIRALLRPAPLNVGGELLSRMCALQDLSVIEIQREWSHLCGQIKSGLDVPNPGGLLCERLLRARGLKMPRRDNKQPMAAALATAMGELGDLQRVINQRRRMLIDSSAIERRLSGGQAPGGAR